MSAPSESEPASAAREPEPASGPLPEFRVVRGNPTPEELAALVVVLRAALASSDAPAPAPPTNGWSAYWRSVRAPLRPGPGAWPASARP